MTPFLAHRATIDADATPSPPAPRSPSTGTAFSPWQVATPPASRPGPATPHQHDRVPTVECIRHGDRITRLVVTCACGERLEIDCLYPGAG